MQMSPELFNETEQRLMADLQKQKTSQSRPQAGFYIKTSGHRRELCIPALQPQGGAVEHNR